MTSLYDFATACALLLLWTCLACLAGWILAVGVLPVSRQLYREWARSRRIERYRRQLDREVWR